LGHETNRRFGWYNDIILYLLITHEHANKFIPKSYIKILDNGITICLAFIDVVFLFLEHPLYRYITGV